MSANKEKLKISLNLKTLMIIQGKLVVHFNSYI